MFDALDTPPTSKAPLKPLPKKAYLVGASLSLGAGCIGAIVHAVLSLAPPAGPLVNEYIGLWFALMVVATSVEVLRMLLDHGPVRRWRYLYLAIVSASSFISFVGYCLVPDSTAGAVWNLLVFGLTLLGWDATIQLAKTPPSPPSPSPGLAMRLTLAIFTTLKVVQSILYLLLAAGAIVAASAHSYRSEGTLHTVTTTDGVSFTMNINCQGPASSPRHPTIWIVADAAHGVSDFYGLQQRLVQAGRRVCTQDNPGYGGSAAIPRDLTDFSTFYASMLDVSGEPRDQKVVFVAWAGGSPQVFAFAKAHPARVASFISLILAPDGFEHMDYQNRTGCTPEQLQAHIAQDFSGRRALARLVLAVAIPLPLTPLFMPIGTLPTFEPAARYTELKTQAWKSRFWMAQSALLPSVEAASIAQVQYDLPPTIPYTSVLCNRSAAQVCLDNTRNCTEAVRANEFAFRTNSAFATRIQANATVIYNTDDDCSLLLPVNKPQFAAAAVLDALSRTEP